MSVRGGCARGMVTVEAALVTVVLAVVATGCLWLAAAVFQLGHCQATANEVARQQARGDAVAARRAADDAPRGARVSVRRAGGQSIVVVALDVAVGPWSLPVAAEARVLDEVGA